MPRSSIYIRILVFFSLLVFIPVAVTTYVNYRSEVRTIEEEQARVLEDLVNAVAPRVDGDLISVIQRGKDNEIKGKEEFDAILKVLLEILEARGLSRGQNPIYVLRSKGGENPGALEYVVMTSLDRRGNYFVGRSYAALPEQIAALNGRSAVTGIYTDLMGTWISAVTPIYDSNRDVVAIAQANLPVQYLYDELWKNALSALRVALFSLLLCGVPALLFARSLVKPIRELVKATQRFANNELEYRLRSKRRDEIGDLARKFDWMAEQLLVDRLKRVETEASLRSSEAEARKLALVASRTDGAVTIMDAEGRIEWVNHSFHRITGYNLDDVEACPLMDVLEGDETDADAARKIRGGLNGGNGCTEELVVHRKDGKPIWCAMELQPVRNSSGRIVNYVAIQNDITQRREAAQELQKAKDTAELANKAKSEFLAVMSHEIRTPMNAILGFTNLLLGTRMNAQQRDYTETIQNSGEALLSLLNDILDFSKIESGRMDLESEPFDLRQCVEGALDLIAANAGRKGIEVLSKFDPELPRWFVGDVTRLRQIMVNLAGNAVKFTEQGEIEVSIEGEEIRVERGTEWLLHVRVRDSGVGIPEERKERLFKPFSQVDQSITRRFGGTGLGLVICKRICELMKGRIWVESEVGKGSVFQFIVQIPAAKDEKPDPWVLNPDRITGRRVLVVDDNRLALDHLQDVLRKWGMKPAGATSIEEAENLCRGEDDFEVVLLDSSFMSHDGATFTAKVSNGELLSAKVVALCTVGTEDGAREYFGDRCPAVVSKPVHLSLLFNCINELLSGDSVSGATTFVSPSVMDATLGDRVPLKILLAEDNLTNQKLATLILKQMGYKAEIANNGVEALNAIKRDAFDLILMDVQMPEMDGLEATRQIRALQQEQGGSRVRIVAMTANATVADKDKCLEAGMDDYVSKPVRPEALQRALVRGRDKDVKEERDDAEIRRGRSIAAAEQAIRELCDALEPEGVIEMAESFFKDVPEMIGELHTSSESGNLQDLERAAHSLKGAAGIFNWQSLAECALKVEDLAEAGDMEAATEGIKEIEEEYETAHGALEGAVLRLKESL